ncbi:hypothetical protein H5410_030625 [Solanum commersonii]|uniref:Uncharacterized protein n=1 Tax=Solanum commersonii TaxID=4109 RepID=A0A9J5YHF8_SOLCO|nr:hypothetical protein H5410_030625 [Solanum commersonii]
MNGAKRSAEAVGCKNISVGEHSALERSLRASGGGRSGSENVGLSNANIGKNPMPRKPKGSSARFVHGGPVTSGEGVPPHKRGHSDQARATGSRAKVTEACKGFLGPDGDWPSSAQAEGSLTARPTPRAGMKVGLSDLTVPSERAIQRRVYLVPNRWLTFLSNREEDQTCHRKTLLRQRWAVKNVKKVGWAVGQI